MSKSFFFIRKNCSNRIPKPKDLNQQDQSLLNNLKNDIPKLVKNMNDQNLNEYIKMVVNYSFEANKYFNDAEPWSLKEKDPDRMNSIMYTICEQIKNISILLYPIIPMSAEKVLNSININKEEFSIEIITNFKSFDFKRIKRFRNFI